MSPSSAKALSSVNDAIDRAIELLNGIPSIEGVTKRRRDDAVSCLNRAKRIGESVVRKARHG